MHIAHVLTSLWVGGAEHVALHLASAQAQLGHRVVVVSLETPPLGSMAAAFEAAGLEVLRVPKRPGFDASLFVRLAKVFRRERFDVVHTHNPLPLVYAAGPAKAMRARVIHTKHGSHPDRARRLWLRRVGGYSVDAFVAVSEATADYARTLREVPARKLHVVTNATDLSHFAPNAARREAARSEWQLPSDTLVVGTVGRMAAVKNHALLLRAVAPLLHERCRLVIAGDGPEAEPTRRLARELDVAPWVHLLGMVDDTSSVMAGLDVFVLSSDSEGLPMVLAEAMASALPVVSTAVGGIPKALESGVTGLLVPAGDALGLRTAIEQLLGNAALRRNMGAAGRELAERRYSRQRMVDEYMLLYRG